MPVGLFNNNITMLPNFRKAFSFANLKHQNQTIPGSNLPYISHISSVCFELLLIPDLKKYDSEFLLTVAALHDTLEDTQTSKEEIHSAFGPKVLAAVQALSKNYQLPKEEQIGDSLKRILKEPIEVHLVKIADRISNLDAPPVTWPTDKIAKYYKSSQLIYSKLQHTDDFLSNKLLDKITRYRQYLNETD